VAGDDHTVCADEHRVRPAKPGNRPDDLLDLLGGVRPRIAGVREQRVDWSKLDAVWKLYWNHRLRVKPAIDRQSTGNHAKPV
jgi:hypothetical protein